MNSQNHSIQERNLIDEINFLDKPRSKNLTPISINVINTSEEWERLYGLFNKDFTEPLVIGFDCEWTLQNAISLVQMCNKKGMCLLLRVVNVIKQNSSLPDSFVELLKNKKIIKVGVGIDEDAKRLSGRYGVVVRGCVDLRLLVLRVNHPCVRPLGLKYLSWELLGVELEKEGGVRCGDWDALVLSPKQEHYAAMDSLVSLEIFKQLLALQMAKNAFKLKNNDKEIKAGNHGFYNAKNNEILSLERLTMVGSSVDEMFYDEEEKEEDDYNDNRATTNVDNGLKTKEKDSVEHNVKMEVTKRSGNLDCVRNRPVEDQIIHSVKEEIFPTLNTTLTNNCMGYDVISGASEDGNNAASSSAVESINRSFYGDINGCDANFIMSFCQGIFDVKFKAKNLNKKINESSLKKDKHANAASHTRNITNSGLQGRKTPLYDNCMLLDTQGNPLTTCDSRKALWYLEKNLAEKVSENPLKVRLLFEPAGRPLVGNSYYLQEKFNQCVVCGALESYHRKNIIPREYRKHFPPLFKDHKSHDVILLCPSCHQQSTNLDAFQKQALAYTYNAPIRSDKYEQSQLLLKAKSAAKALSNKHKIPDPRRVQLVAVLQEFYREEILNREAGELVDDGEVVDYGEVISNGEVVYYGEVVGNDEEVKDVGEGGEVHDKNVGYCEEVDEDKLIQFVNGYENKKLNPSYEEHGRIVVAAVSSNKQSLMEFERLWRQHFLDTMQPRFLPSLWSVDHCHQELEQLQ